MALDLNVLKEHVYGYGLRTPSYKKRIANIEWVFKLDKKGLVYGGIEKHLILFKGQKKESLHLRFPGKESAPTFSKVNPHDFRPKLLLLDEDKFVRDLAFFELWSDLEEKLKPLMNRPENKEAVHGLTAILYRMACMVDHELTTDSTKITYRTVHVEDGVDTLVEESEFQPSPYYRYSPDKKVLEEISKRVPVLCDMPLDCFLHYVDCLAWNEDCKYHFRWTQAGKPGWMNGQGRPNFLLTVIHFIGLLTGDIRLAEAFKKFGMNGVAPIKQSDIPGVTGGIITQTARTRS